MLLRRRACVVDERRRFCCRHRPRHNRNRSRLSSAAWALQPPTASGSATRRMLSTSTEAPAALGRAVDYRVADSPVSAHERSWRTISLTAAAFGELLRNVRDLQTRADQPPLHALTLDDFPVSSNAQVVDRSALTASAGAAAVLCVPKELARLGSLSDAC
jgi:hypothetical protein